MSGHTPGPWYWQANSSGGARVIAYGLGVAVADVLSRAGVPDPVQEHCEANARLIAAAPDLLAACESALAYLDAYGMDEGSHGDHLRAAIAKARGQ